MRARTRRLDQRTTPPGSWPRFAAAVAVLAVITVAIPAGLIIVARPSFGRWPPIPAIGPWDEIRTWFPHPLTSAEAAPVALRLLVAVAWVVWAALVLSVLSSVVVTRPA